MVTLVQARLIDDHLNSTMGEHDHAALQAALILWFGPRRQKWNLEGLPEQRIQISPTRFRVLDLLSCLPRSTCRASAYEAPLAYPARPIRARCQDSRVLSGRDVGNPVGPRTARSAAGLC